MMKIFFIIILFYFNSFSQELAIPALMEILPQTQNFGSNPQITFTITPLNGVAYCNSVGDFFIDQPNSSSLTINENYLYPDNIYPYTGGDYGFDACYSNDYNNKFWLTVNKVTISYQGYSFYFYIDYRDCGYGTMGQDVTIRYDYNWGYFISGGLNINIPTNGQSPSTCGFQSISQGDVFRIGELNNYSVQSTSCLSSLSFWSNSLVITDHPGFPQIVWGPHPTFTPVSGYKIYRKVVLHGYAPGNPLSYSLLATVGLSTFSYNDLEYTKGGQYYDIYYYVKAYYNSTFSECSNIVGTSVNNNNYKMANPIKSEKTAKFDLLENYPNPFNPTTIIDYQIPSDCYVTIKVYDSIGKEVATLINSRLAAGKYSTDFSATGGGSNLSSGIFFCVLRAGDFVSTKKMMLVK